MFDASIELDQVNHGINGFIAFEDPDGDRYLSRTTGDTFTFDSPEDGPPKIYKTRTTTGTKPDGSGDSGTLHETYTDPWDTSSFTRTGDEGLTQVTIVVSDPWSAEEVSTPPNAGDWQDDNANEGWGDGHSGFAEGVGFYPLYSLGAGLAVNSGIHKRRWRLRVSKAGFAGGGVRLQIIKHQLQEDVDLTPSDAFALFGLSTIPTDTNINATLTAGDLSLTATGTIGKLGEILTPNCSGNWKVNGFGGLPIRVDSRIDPAITGDIKKPFIYAMFDDSEVTKKEYLVTPDPDSMGDYLVSAWEEVPDPEEWYMQVWYFLIDWPCVGIEGGEALLPDDEDTGGGG